VLTVQRIGQSERVCVDVGVRPAAEAMILT
jgi:hypothetical protein